MDEVIWIEVLSRHRAVLSRHRCTGRGVRIGRAYTNDVILDDPYVAPEHAHVARDDDGRLVVEDLGTANGLQASHGSARLDRLALGDDTIFRVGHTYLRLRRTDHAVAAERQFGEQTQLWPAVLALAAAVAAGEAASRWLGDYGEPKAVTYVVPLLAVSAAVALWAALWSIVARVFAGQARFERNLTIALAGALGIEAVGAAAAVGAFGLSWSALASYSYIGFLFVVAVASFAHLRLIQPARSLVAGGVVAVVLVAVAAVQLVVQSDDHRPPSLRYVRNLMPPALRLAPVKDEAAFFTGVETLRSQIDADRTEEP
jgi:hypothetical protein